MSYVWEKLYTAVHGLVTSEKSLQERLIDAYIYSVMRLNEDDFPENLKEEYRQFHDDITKVASVGDEGTVRATVNAMGNSEASRMIEKILSMYDRITRREEER